MDQVLAGRYVLEVPLGRGGSGEVWRGSDMATHKPVALKLVELTLIDDPSLLTETVGRFRRETSVISGLRHPNVVGAIDAGRIGNQLFLVMELAPGISLAAMMDERGVRGMGLFPVTSVLRIAGQVCAGLAAAHAADIVHRDIKPSNLMVTPSLGVKIIDFGVARLLADNATRLAVPAQTVGTVAYMSPEQAQGLDVDGRSDLYSLGCVLYQLLAGHPPFFSTLPSALLMMQVMDRPAPLADVRPDLPPELCQLVSDLMEKERDARPANAEQVASRIEAVRSRLGDEEPEFEADRQTIMSRNHLGADGVTRLDSPELDRGLSPVLPPGRMADLTGPNVMAAGPWAAANGQPFQPPAPFPPPIQPMVPSQTGPIRSLPQAVARTGPGAGAGGPGPRWPAAVPPPRRRAWPGVLATLLVAVLVAGGGAYYWLRAHQVLKITDVVVTAASTKVGCNGTAHLIGTITTNGHGGPVTYEWVLNQAKKPVLTAEDGAGGKAVQVTMSWSFHGKGTGTDVAKLDILSPQHAQSSITFPYSCPK
ncbi:MAG TPA: serine/threonine-protein kinase [Trebonia sp.]|nr:serine/threonine-protein kinase [Trebonia sp.]